MNRARNIYSYTADGSDTPEFLSIYEIDGKIIVASRPAGCAIGELELPRDELLKLLGRLTAEVRKPSNRPLLGS